MTHLEFLPDLVLKCIFQYLDSKDCMCLIDASPYFESFRRFLPKYQDITHGELNARGPNYGHFEPETWFDISPMYQGIKSMDISFSWKDQGWGNRKGEVWVQLLRKRQVLADSREKFYKLAPHELEERTFEIKKHPVVDLLRRGDTLRFMYNAGGGGGHRLEVKNFRVRLNLKKYRLIMF